MILLFTCTGWTLPAFPGAQGAGAESIGGRGGVVLIVTNTLDYDSNEEPIEGSLRYALEEVTEPRIVVFQTSGLIELKRGLVISSPYITIAGQTAPGDGICLKNYGLNVNTNDVIIRYIRVRPGDGVGRELESQGNTDGWDTDGISIGSPSENVILDHLSASWGNDEVLSVSGAGQDKITVQWSFITESLHHSTHDKGAHGYGSLIRTNGRVSFHHNLWAFHASRSPRPGTYPENSSVDESILFDCRSNFMYMGGRGYSADDPVRMNFVNNYHSGTRYEATGTTHVYALGNEGEFTGGNEESTPYDINIIPVTEHTAQQARDLILNYGGSNFPTRDSVDIRIASQIENAQGDIINSADDVGGWPEYVTGPNPDDSDNDGMPDAWEQLEGLDPDDGSDADGTGLSSEGYTNIEMYINSLVADNVPVNVFKDWKSYRKGPDQHTENSRDILGRFIKTPLDWRLPGTILIRVKPLD